MTTLDTLARRSSAAIHTSVAHVPIPVGGILPTSRFVILRRSSGYALAGAAAAVFAVIAMLSFATPSDDVTDVTNTTTAPPTTVAEVPIDTTLPANGPERVVPVVPPVVTERGPAGDTTPPLLTIVSPETGVHTTRSSAVVTGLTEQGTKVAGPSDVTIEVDREGVWRTTVSLDVGENRFRFVATDTAGNTSTASLVINRDAPPTTTTTKPSDTTTTTTEAPGWEFTAHKTYGSCSETPPYDIYYGTGKPGTEITVTSDYGGGSTVIQENGEWSVKVFFTEPPANVGFLVKVTHFDGAKVSFEFTHTPV